MLAIAIALTRSWTAFYTRGLPADLRCRRRDEIESDLWEQRRLDDFERTPAAGTAVEVLLRLVLGAPADIIWRIETGENARTGKGTQMNESSTTRGLFIFALIVAALPIIWGASRVAGEGGGGAAWGSATLLAGVVLIAGLLLIRRNPVLGLWLVAAGALGVALLLFWMFFIVIPALIVIGVVAYKRARSTGWRFRSGDVPNATA
jgi:protein-S-isoprenylcysteine O-methyltransferase Ste14